MKYCNEKWYPPQWNKKACGYHISLPYVSHYCIFITVCQSFRYLSSCNIIDIPRKQVLITSRKNEIKLTFYLQIAITFFKNKKGIRGVLIDPFDYRSQLKNKDKEYAPPYNHFEGLWKQNIIQRFNTTGPIDKNGKPITDDIEEKNSADVPSHFPNNDNIEE